MKNKRIGRRVDVLEKVMGKAVYANDIHFDDMLYVKVVRSPISHGKIVSIDSEKALALEGVVKVLTGKDIPGIPCQPTHKPMLAVDVVRYYGEGVAIVIGEDMEILEEAVDLVAVTYEEYTAAFTPEDALKPEAARIHKEAKGNILCEYVAGKGDVEAGFKKADRIIEREYTTSHQEHMPIEPEASVVVPNVNGTLTVYAPTNSTYNVRQTIADALQLNETKVSLQTPVIGGSFGGKNYDLAAMCSRLAMAAVATGRPCKMVYNREESIIEGTKRHPIKTTYKVGVTNEGKITALDAFILGDGGAYTSKSHPVATRATIEVSGPYEIENVHSSITLAYTNNVYADAQRGFGSPQVDFASEVLFDEIAKELGMTPLEFKKKNHFKEGSISGVGQVMQDVSLGKCMDKVLAAIDFKKRQEEIKLENKVATNRKRRGIGFALLHRGEAFGAAGQGLDTAAASLLVNWDGSIAILSSLSEVGNGIHTMLVNVVHETLGVSRERMDVTPVDTNCVPNTGPTVATRGTIVGGNAMRLAAEETRDKLAETAAIELGVEKEVLVFKDERIFAPDCPDKYISYLEAVSKNFARGKEANGHGWYTISGLEWDRQKGCGDAYLSYAYGACATEIEVDLDTGQVSVEKFVAAHDVGHAFDVEEVKGQINGGVSMGLGFALMEDVGMKNGRMSNVNFDKYLIFTSMDMPEIIPIVVEEPNKTGPHGAKGLGEPTACSVAPAIINAIADATGIYIRELPATLEKVQKAVLGAE